MKSNHSLSTTLCAAAFASLFAGIGAPAHADTCIQLEVQNVQPGKGNLMVAAYAAENSFDKTQASGQQVPAGAAATQTLMLCNLPGQQVAIKMYQDVNGYGKLESNVLGVPTEPWGASGKVPALLAPTWESSVVPLDGKAMVIKLSN